MKKKIVLFLFLFLISVSSQTNAGWGSDFVPKPMWKANIGPVTAKEAADRAESIYVAYQKLYELQSILEGNKDIRTLNRMLTAGSSLGELSDKDWGDMTYEEYKEVVNLGYEAYINSEETQKIIADNVMNNEIADQIKEAGEELDNATKPWKEKEVNNPEDLKKAQDRLDYKSEEIDKMYFELILKYEDEVKMPGGNKKSKDIINENSKTEKDGDVGNYSTFIEDMQKEIVRLKDQYLKEGEKGTGNAQEQLNNMLQIYSLQIKLRELQMLKDMNRMMIYSSYAEHQARLMEERQKLQRYRNNIGN